MVSFMTVRNSTLICSGLSVISYRPTRQIAEFGMPSLVESSGGKIRGQQNPSQRGTSKNRTSLSLLLRLTEVRQQSVVVPHGVAVIARAQCEGLRDGQRLSAAHWQHCAVRIPRGTTFCNVPCQIAINVQPTTVHHVTGVVSVELIFCNQRALRSIHGWFRSSLQWIGATKVRISFILDRHREEAHRKLLEVYSRTHNRQQGDFSARASGLEKASEAQRIMHNAWQKL